MIKWGQMKNNSSYFRLWAKIALGAIILGLVGISLAPYWQGLKPLSPVLIDLGRWQVHWYGAILAIATLAGVGLTWRLARGRIPSDRVLEAAIWMIVGGLSGARLMFVLLKWPIYAADPVEILMFGRGGMSIHGALLGGLVALMWYARRAKLNFWQLVDLAVPGVVVGQIIGRFGNFFNQEAFGSPTSLPWKLYIAPANRPIQLLQEPYFHPTFIYEALLNVVVLAVLLRLYHRQLPAGSLLAWYLILYSSLRFILEWFRVDSDLWGTLTIAQWASLALVGVGIYLLRQRHHA